MTFDALKYFGFDIQTVSAGALRRLRNRLEELPGMDRQREDAIAALDEVIARKKAGQENKPVSHPVDAK